MTSPVGDIARYTREGLDLDEECWKVSLYVQYILDQLANLMTCSRRGFNEVTITVNALEVR